MPVGDKSLFDRAAEIEQKHREADPGGSSDRAREMRAIGHRKARERGPSDVDSVNYYTALEWIAKGDAEGTDAASIGNLNSERARNAELQKQIDLERELASSSSRARDAAVKQGTEFAKSVIPEGSLGRVDAERSAETTDIIARRRAGLEGLSSENLQAERDVAAENIARAGETSRRSLQSAQAGSGVRGATAGAQVERTLGEAQDQRRQFERDLFLRQAEVKRQALNDFEQSVTGAQATQLDAQKFNLQQAAAEKFAQISTGLGFASLEAGQSASAAAIASQEAAAASQRGGGGGLSIICTELYNQGKTDNESRDLAHNFRKNNIDLDTYHGYLLWATPVVNLMKKSQLVTKFVNKFIYKPVISYMSGKNIFFGKLVYKTGIGLAKVLSFGRKLKEIVKA